MGRWMTVAIVAMLAGCSKKADQADVDTSSRAPSATPAQAAAPAAASATAAPPGDQVACAATTCADCTHEGGCWWNKKTKTCQLGLPKGVKPEKDPSWVNDGSQCAF